MSEEDKNNKDFKFIKEEVVQNKRSKFKKTLKPFIKVFIMAIIFGTVAAVTFCFVEPRIYKHINKEEEDRKSITFPNSYPDEKDEEVDSDNPEEGNEDPDDTDPEEQEPNVDTVDPIVVEKIEASVDDYIKIYEGIRAITTETSKSIIKIDSVIDGTDLFGNPAEIRNTTCGLVIADINDELAILVSYDRIKEANRIQVVFSEHVMVDAKLLDYDNELNLAVLNVLIEDIPALYYNNIETAKLGESYGATMGMPIIALGNLNGSYGSMGVGHITNQMNYISVIDNKIERFDTSIIDNEKTDGVIANLEGEIIGIITRKLKDDINKNINTVIGITRLKPIIQQMANNEPRIYLGVVADDLTEEARQRYDVRGGIYINETITESPAYNGGLKSGDIITEIEGQEVYGINNYHSILNEYEPGNEINIKIRRTSAHNKELEFDIILEGRNK